jgi:hypothetical protein
MVTRRELELLSYSDDESFGEDDLLALDAKTEDSE